MTPDDQNIAEAIKSLRAELGESQQKFSDRLGVVVRTVARYELEKVPTGETLLRLARIADEANRQDLRLVFNRAYARTVVEGFNSLSKEFGEPYFVPYLDLVLLLLVFGGEEFEARLSRFVKRAANRLAEENGGSLPGEVLADLKERLKKLKD